MLRVVFDTSYNDGTTDMYSLSVGGYRCISKQSASQCFSAKLYEVYPRRLIIDRDSPRSECDGARNTKI